MKRSPIERTTPLRRKPRSGDAQRTYNFNRAKVERRAEGLCEVRVDRICQHLGDQAHHRLRRSQGGSDQPSNLIWTCSSCHGHIHANPAWAYEHDFLRRSVA